MRTIDLRRAVLLAVAIVAAALALPGCATLGARAVSGDPLGYRLEGRFTVDAGPLGTPTFGPSTLLRGEVRAFR